MLLVYSPWYERDFSHLLTKTRPFRVTNHHAYSFRSQFGAGTTIVGFWYNKRKQTQENVQSPPSSFFFSFRSLIFWLAVADFFTSLARGIAQIILLADLAAYRYSMCIGMRFPLVFFTLSTFFWTSCIAFEMYQQVSEPLPNPKPARYVFVCVRPFPARNNHTFSRSLSL